MDITIDMVLFILFAGFIASVVRMYDVPVSKAAIVPFVLTFGASLIAAVLSFWMLSSEGNAPLTFVTFAVVAGSSVGGLSAVRAIIEKVSPSAEPSG